MADMSPEEMAALQEQAGVAPKEGGATQLAKQVGDGLSQLAEMLDGSPGATDEDRAQMSQIMQLYIDLVEKKLAGSAPGQNAPPEEDGVSQPVPANAGPNGVPMGPGM